MKKNNKVIQMFNMFAAIVSLAIILSSCAGIPAKHPVNNSLRALKDDSLNDDYRREVTAIANSIVNEWGDWDAVMSACRKGVQCVQKHRSNVVAQDGRPDYETHISEFEKIFRYASLKKEYEVSIKGLRCYDFEENAASDEEMGKLEAFMQICNRIESQKELFSDPEIEDMHGMLKYALKTHRKASIEKTLAKASEIIEKAEDPHHAIKACEMVLELVEKALKDDIWDYSEEKVLDKLRKDAIRMKEEIRKGYESIKSKNQSELESERSEFVIDRAATDLRVARDMYSKEAGKWFNPGAFVGWHPRDNVDNLYRAVRLCDRIRSDGRAGYLLQSEAHNTTRNICERLSSKEKTWLNSYPAIPGYAEIPGYPNWDVEAKTIIDWRGQKLHGGKSLDIEGQSISGSNYIKVKK